MRKSVIGIGCKVLWRARLVDEVPFPVFLIIPTHQKCCHAFPVCNGMVNSLKTHLNWFIVGQDTKVYNTTGGHST